MNDRRSAGDETPMPTLPAGDALLDDLAAAQHELFCEGLRAQGMSLGAITDSHTKTHAQLKPYGDLAPSEKIQYRESARRLLDTLTAAGCVLVGTDATQTVAEVDLETLAAADHQHWLDTKIAAGWRYSPKTDNSQKLHSALLPWRTLSARDRTRLPPFVVLALGPGELPEAKKQLCREIFRDVPRLLTKAGYRVRPVTSDPAAEPADASTGPRVFISARSTDYGYAEEVYRFLLSAGASPFFSQESLPELGSSDYRHQIDRALEEAEHLIVVTSSADNVRAAWVEAEWGFFINEKRSGRKSGNLVTVIVGALKAAELPPSLRYYEVIPFDALDKVLGYVKSNAGRRED